MKKGSAIKGTLVLFAYLLVLGIDSLKVAQAFTKLTGISIIYGDLVRLSSLNENETLVSLLRRIHQENVATPKKKFRFSSQNSETA